ncbi:hypothetical protein GGI21_004142 [Coemansia aciculifera]|nr:hypothetical protein GGI21_004142 [Coemansia aciculifera]
MTTFTATSFICPNGPLKGPYKVHMVDYSAIEESYNETSKQLRILDPSIPPEYMALVICRHRLFTDDERAFIVRNNDDPIQFSFFVLFMHEDKHYAFKDSLEELPIELVDTLTKAENGRDGVFLG